MPELPEVEVLVQHLRPLLRGKSIRGVVVRRQKTIAPATAVRFASRLKGARFIDVYRRGKYLVFKLRRQSKTFNLVGHLGMTGRMYLSRRAKATRQDVSLKSAQRMDPVLPKHCPVWFDLGSTAFVFEDYRYFGRLTLEESRVSRLGIEPLGPEFTTEYLAERLAGRRQCIKTILLDQRLIAGIGNIYASEILFRAHIAPVLAAGLLTRRQLKRLRQATVEVLNEAIQAGSTLTLDFAGANGRDGLFYFGSAKVSGRTRADRAASYRERLLVYDRAGDACVSCGERIRRIVQGGRSSFFCPQCQGPEPPKKGSSLVACRKNLN